MRHRHGADPQLGGGSPQRQAFEDREPQGDAIGRAGLWILGFWSGQQIQRALAGGQRGMEAAVTQRAIALLMAPPRDPHQPHPIPQVMMQRPLDAAAQIGRSRLSRAAAGSRKARLNRSSKGIAKGHQRPFHGIRLGLLEGRFMGLPDLAWLPADQGGPSLGETFFPVPMVSTARVSPALAALALLSVLTSMAKAQTDVHQHHHHPAPPAPAAVPGSPSAAMDHSDHGHSIGPAGVTYDLRWLDAMVQHHTGALRMSAFVFDIGQPGVGALAKTIWRSQAQEIKAMGQWRNAWYPEAPVYPVALKAGGDPDTMAGLERMSPAQMQAMRMTGTTPTRENRVTWFLEGMIAHHGGALVMAHDALRKTANPTIRRLARQIIVAQRREITELRRMLRRDGLDKPEYYQFDALFSF